MSIDLSIFNTFDVKWLLQDVGKAGEVQFNNAQNIIEMILFTPFLREIQEELGNCAPRTKIEPVLTSYCTLVTNKHFN
jgi:hypothetical protein